MCLVITLNKTVTIKQNKRPTCNVVMTFSFNIHDLGIITYPTSFVEIRNSPPCYKQYNFISYLLMMCWKYREATLQFFPSPCVKKDLSCSFTLCNSSCERDCGCIPTTNISWSLPVDSLTISCRQWPSCVSGLNTPKSDDRTYFSNACKLTGTETLNYILWNMSVWCAVRADHAVWHSNDFITQNWSSTEILWHCYCTVNVLLLHRYCTVTLPLPYC
jgi:hypothetical protein